MDSHRLIMSNASFGRGRHSPGPGPIELGTMMGKFQQTLFTPRLTRPGRAELPEIFCAVHGLGI